MKQVTNLTKLLNSLRRVMYAGMVLVLAISIALLSYMELAHTSKQEVRATNSLKQISSVANQIKIVKQDKQPS